MDSRFGIVALIFSLHYFFAAAHATSLVPNLILPHRGCYVLGDTINDLSSVVQFKLSDVSPVLCTYITYGFAFIQDNELQITPKDEENLIVTNLMRKANPALNVFLALDGGDAKVTEQMILTLASTQNRTDFISTVVEKLRVWRLDGFVIHLESLDWAAANVVGLIIKDLKVKFAEESVQKFMPRLVLVLNVGHYAKASRIDPALIGSHADIVQVRAFDYHSPDFEPTTTGHTAPLYRSPGSSFSRSQSSNIDDSLNDWVNQGIPKSKMVLGVALYGQVWKLSSKYRYEAGAPSDGKAPASGYMNVEGRLSFHDICERLNSENLTRVFDSNAMAPFAHSNESLTWVSYDDPESARIKARWILEKNYSGIVFWELSLEDFNGSCSDKPYSIVQNVFDVLTTAAVQSFQQKRECDREFCTKRGPGVFAMGGCLDMYCNCDYGGKAYKVTCGPETIFDPLILACNYAASVKACEFVEAKVKLG